MRVYVICCIYKLSDKIPPIVQFMFLFTMLTSLNGIRYARIYNHRAVVLLLHGSIHKNRL